MNRRKSSLIDIEIDDLTNSIQNAISGDSFATEILPLREWDFKEINIKNSWEFDWKKEFKSAKRDVYKLTIEGNPNIVQGLISLSDEKDHLFMHLIESAPFNIGKKKLYLGVPGNLIAFGCKLSKDYGYNGFLAFVSKTKLVEHYQTTLGATPFGKGARMIIYPNAAEKLISRYFK